MGVMIKNGIRYTGGSSLPNYSTTEQDTGLKWIDDKPIYQKTYNYNSVSSQTTTEDLSSLNIETVVDAKGMFSSGSGSGVNDYVAPVPWVEPYNVTSSAINMFYLPYSKTFNLRKVNSGMTVTSMFFTIWYTKTTD